jgi:hypothetical protein
MVARAADDKTPESDRVTSDGYRLGNVVNLSRRKVRRRKPVRDIDFFYCVGPIMHSARNANDNAILVKVEKRVLSEPDKASITAVQTSARARLPQGHPR